MTVKRLKYYIFNQLTFLSLGRIFEYSIEYFSILIFHLSCSGFLMSAGTKLSQVNTCFTFINKIHKIWGETGAGRCSECRTNFHEKKFSSLNAVEA